MSAGDILFGLLGCEACGICCEKRKKILVTTEEIKNDVVLSSSIKKDLLDTTTEGKMCSMHKVDGICASYNKETRKCGRYDTRYLTCKHYPFYTDNNRIYIATTCPKISKIIERINDESVEKDLIAYYDHMIATISPDFSDWMKEHISGFDKSISFDIIKLKEKHGIK